MTIQQIADALQREIGITVVQGSITLHFHNQRVLTTKVEIHQKVTKDVDSAAPTR